MLADGGQEQRSGYSRRGLLGSLFLGLAAVAGGGLLIKSLLLPGGKRAEDSSAEFPGPDSIFHPRSDPKREAIERRWKT